MTTPPKATAPHAAPSAEHAWSPEQLAAVEALKEHFPEFIFSARVKLADGRFYTAGALNGDRLVADGLVVSLQRRLEALWREERFVSSVAHRRVE